MYEKNRSLIIEQISEMCDNSSSLSQIRMWKVKQKVCPKYDVDTPIAKLDSSRNLVTNLDELKKLYVDTYQDRLRYEVSCVIHEIFEG